MNSRSFRGVACLAGVPARESSCTTRGDAARVVFLRLALFPVTLEAEGAFNRVAEPFGDAGAGVTRDGERDAERDPSGEFEVLGVRLGHRLEEVGVARDGERDLCAGGRGLLGRVTACQGLG